MSISSISSNAAPVPVQRAPEAAEVRSAGGDHDGDADDGGVRAAAPAPKPVVNTSGPLTGQNINTRA